MIGAVFQNVLGGYLQPRASVRRMLDAGHGLDVALLMVVLAYLIVTIFTILIQGGRPSVDDVSLGVHVFGLVANVVIFIIITAIVFRVGRFFGGQGTWAESALAMGWFTLVTSVIEPLTLPARIDVTEMMAAAANGEQIDPGALPAGEVAIFMVVSAIILWIFACYVAELHRFKSTWKVLATVLGLSAAFSMALTALVPGT
jgi:hypothetical protein